MIYFGNFGGNQGGGCLVCGWADPAAKKIMFDSVPPQGSGPRDWRRLCFVCSRSTTGIRPSGLVKKPRSATGIRPSGLVKALFCLLTFHQRDQALGIGEVIPPSFSFHHRDLALGIGEVFIPPSSSRSATGIRPSGLAKSRFLLLDDWFGVDIGLARVLDCLLLWEVHCPH